MLMHVLDYKKGGRVHGEHFAVKRLKTEAVCAGAVDERPRVALSTGRQMRHQGGANFIGEYFTLARAQLWQRHDTLLAVQEEGTPARLIKGDHFPFFCHACKEGRRKKKKKNTVTSDEDKNTTTNCSPLVCQFFDRRKRYTVKRDKKRAENSRDWQARRCGRTWENSIKNEWTCTEV